MDNPRPAAEPAGAGPEHQSDKGKDRSGCHAARSGVRSFGGGLLSTCHRVAIPLLDVGNLLLGLVERYRTRLSKRLGGFLTRLICSIGSAGCKSAQRIDCVCLLYTSDAADE